MSQDEQQTGAGMKNGSAYLSVPSAIFYVSPRMILDGILDLGPIGIPNDTVQ